MRRIFELAEDDVMYLNNKGYSWETIQEGRDYWLLIHNFPIPEGYNVSQATVAIQFTDPLDYLRVGLDMVFFNPALSRLDGIVIRQTQYTHQIDGKSFQRWSRHRTREAPWEYGNDSLSTHLLLVEYWLKREFEVNVR